MLDTPHTYPTPTLLPLESHPPPTPTISPKAILPISYTHPAITGLNLKTRGVHTKIIDLQSLLNTHKKPNIVALAETEHKNIKSIWRHTLKNYKLVYKPSLYNKKTKLTSAGTSVAIDKNTYTGIGPIHVQTTIQPYLAIALLQPKSGFQILATSIYMPQLHTPQGQLIYRDLLSWLKTLFNEEHPTLPILIGRGFQATPQPKYKSHYLPLRELRDATSLTHIGDPHTPTLTPTASPLERWLLRPPPHTLTTRICNHHNIQHKTQ